MQRVSTNLTLFYKFFVPIFWIVFFGSMTIAAFVYKKDYYGEIPGTPFRIGMVVFFLSGVLMFLLTIMRLKRVELSEDHLYVTNYFKHLRYPYQDIEKISESEFAIFKVVTVYLKAPGTFGKKFTFLASRDRYAEFWREHSDLHNELTFQA
jgi:hypothetical protein